MSRIPADLVVHRVWVPEHDSDPRLPVVYVSELRRRALGAILIGLGAVLAISVVVARAAFWVAFACLLVAWAGVAYAAGGRTGFYEVDPGGVLGKYLGRSRPDVGSMRPSKP